MANSISFTVVSLNCRDFNSLKSSYIKMLLSTVTVLLLQEHWLSESIRGNICNIDSNSNFLFTAVSGFDNSVILSGRPYGGCAIIWRSDVNANVEVLGCVLLKSLLLS
jgi:hypothetical protein